jgi:hypothetical protein
MTTTPLTQENQPTPKPKRKKLKLLGVVVLFLLLVAVPVSFFLVPFGGEPSRTPWYYVSRDGALFDLSTSDPLIVRMAVTNSFDAILSPNAYMLNNEITPSGSFVTTLEDSKSWRAEEYQYERLSNQEYSNYFLLGTPSAFEEAPSETCFTTYSINTRDAVSNEVLSSEKLFEYEGPHRGVSIYPLRLLFEDKLLFRRSCGYKTSEDYSEEIFWYVKSNDQWTKIPLDFGVKENVALLGFEIVREKQSILFLLASEREKKAYLVSYNYQSFAVEKMIELPSDCSSSDSRMRVLSGARYFSVNYWEKETRSFKLDIFSTNDLTKVKEITLPNFCNTSPDFIVSPNLRYVAYGSERFCLYDVELQQEFYLRSYLPAFYRRLFSDYCHKLCDFDYRRESPQNVFLYAIIFSSGFSEDSRFLFAADTLGNVYQWDVENKKRM